MFVKRALSSVVLVIIAAVTILAGDVTLLLTLSVISLIAYSELMKAVSVHVPDTKVNALELAGYLGIIAYYGVIYFANTATYIMLTTILVMMGMMAVYVFGFPKFHANQVMSAYFCVIYAPVMFSFIYLTRELEYGIYLVWMIFIGSWICDTCAYLVGMTIGRHKLAPKLSPKKSIEGAIGGVAGATVIGALYGYWIVEPIIETQQITWVFALISAVGAVISQVGDLAASAIKRNHDIKDYGKLIPGHGGIMDRFDSVIVTAPMIYFLAVLLIQ